MTLNVSAPDTTRALQRRAKKILSRLKRVIPHPSVELEHRSPLELLISTILSAQCTDARVNIVTKDLFKKYRTVKDYANADLRALEHDIHSTGFFHMKAKHIIACCRILVQEYDGNVPETMEQLTALPGVGRKTANVVLSNGFGKIEGIVVDTHVSRVSQRLGLSKQKSAEKIEEDLMGIISKEEWNSTGNLFVLHGRKTCDARKPKCKECVINDLCPSAGTFIRTSL